MVWDFRLQVVLGKITRVYRLKHVSQKLYLHFSSTTLHEAKNMLTFILDCHEEPIWPWSPGITQASEFLSRTAFIELT